MGIAENPTGRAWQSGRKPVGGKQFSAKEKHVPGEKMYYVRSENQVSNISMT